MKITIAMTMLGSAAAVVTTGEYCMYESADCSGEPREDCKTIAALMASMSGSGAITCADGVLAASGLSGIPADLASGTCIAGGPSFSSKFVCDPALPPCFARDTQATLASGESIPMSELKAGDYVLDAKDLFSTTRVIVNQHAKADHLRSSLLTIEHARGKISLTADHVLSVNGNFEAAREAIVGSKLGESEVTKVTRSIGGIINPLTTSGKINADGVLATTYPEWIAPFALSYPIYLTATNALSFAFPATTQAYYDAVLESSFASTVSSLQAVPAPLVAVVFHLTDLLVSAGLVVYTLASLKAVLAIAAVITMTKGRK